MKAREIQGEFLSLSGIRAPQAEQAEIPTPQPHVYQVAELTQKIRGLLEPPLTSILVEGEICNYRRQSSGHHYFGIKDDTSQISCVLFRSVATSLKNITLADGLLVQLKGDLSVYAARGQYQINVRHIRPRGEGQLQAQFEALKEKLRKEGLFETERKCPLPRFPRRIGLITSPSAAALQDFLKVLKHRFPSEILLAPVRVQGSGASLEIAAALRQFASPQPSLPRVDVIVVIRGGGSTEDLWEFNEEIVARAIAESPIPVITGIGHETDFTMADFVADFRAPTPTAAAMAVLPDKEELRQTVQTLRQSLYRLIRDRIERLRAQIDSLARTGVFREPRRRIFEARQEVDLRIAQLTMQVRQQVEQRRQRLQHIQSLLRLHSPSKRLQADQERLTLSSSRLCTLTQHRLEATQERLHRLIRMLGALDPKQVLTRGFTMTMTTEGQLLTSAEDARKSKQLKTIFSNGEVLSDTREE